MTSKAYMQKRELQVQEQLKEENWGYFRPGFYPIQKDGIAPAMICLGEKTDDMEHNIQFILIKPSYYLDDWEDALLISENDFEQITESMNTLPPSKNSSEKLQALTEQFLNRGYLPLSKIIPNIQLNNVH